jgi:hypothetical protein
VNDPPEGANRFDREAIALPVRANAVAKRTPGENPPEGTLLVRYNQRMAVAHRGDIAQLVEHLLCKQGVTGSSPVVSIVRRSVRSADAAAKRT